MPLENSRNNAVAGAITGDKGKSLKVGDGWLAICNNEDGQKCPLFVLYGLSQLYVIIEFASAILVSYG